MNERIRELALEARIAYYSKNGSYEGSDDGLSVIPSTQSLEKFAELIVRECSKIITQGGYWNHALKGRTPASPSEIAKMVEDYFGVEE